MKINLTYIRQFLAMLTGAFFFLLLAAMVNTSSSNIIRVLCKSMEPSTLQSFIETYQLKDRVTIVLNKDDAQMAEHGIKLAHSRDYKELKYFDVEFTAPGPSHTAADGKENDDQLLVKQRRATIKKLVANPKIVQVMLDKPTHRKRAMM